MPRLLGVDIPSEKKTIYSLQYLYGVGQRVARDLCHKAGVDPEGIARNLHEDELARLASLMDKDYVVDFVFKKSIIDIELQFTQLDFVCLFISCI